jgi:hypothetical protein
LTARKQVRILETLAAAYAEAGVTSFDFLYQEL